ncbi:MAG: hypothetical protein PHH44_02285 [bacterium]|nr:hypothetical protein [bacterium]
MMVNLFNYLLISNVFTGGFILFKAGFEFYLGYIFMLAFLFFYFIRYGQPYFSRVFVYSLVLILAVSAVNVWLGNNSWMLLIKQLLGFLLNGLVYYLLIKINKEDLDKLFRIYLKMAVIVAAIGIFQEVSYLLGFTYGYDYSYLVQKMQLTQRIWGMFPVASIFPEPAHFGAAMIPAVFVSLLALIGKENGFISKKAAVLVLVSVLLSFSLISYIGIALTLILLILNLARPKVAAICLITLLVIMYLPYHYIHNIKIRVDDTAAVIAHKIPMEDANVSTFALCSNAVVAYRSLLHNPVFGSGLGSHKISYDSYGTGVINPYHILLNREDAGSLFLRLVSETGLLGIAAFFYFLFRFYVSRKKNGHYWIISNAILCLVALNLIRMGNYFYSGFIFFIWLYYFAHQAKAKQVK